MSKHKRKQITTKNLIDLKQTKDEMGNRTFDASTHDSFVNFMARLGLQADNIHNQSQYNLGPFISRNRLQLEASYRDSWIVGKIVDCIAEDMTRAGCSFYSQMEPKDIKELQVAISEFGIWHDLASTIKWARLYGGAIAVILIDGANYETPLDIEKVGKDKFKGLAVLDRWMLQPSMGDLITDLNQDMGKPKFYEVMAGVSVFPSMKIHHTRVLRFEGIELPYYQRLFENLWGLSVVERMFDRLLAFDSATTGAAQLVYKAYLRTIGVKGFREALALGGRDEIAVIKQFEYIRQMQNNEGITVLDSEDSFATHQYSFSGLDDLLAQFGQQISGAVDIPLVRLFGQSPRGFSTGDTDLRNYYDHINKLQENQLRRPLEKLLAVIAMSRLGKPLPEDFEFDFVSLWQLSETEKAAIAQTDSNTMSAAHEAGTITKAAALKELLQSSRVTGRFSNITEKDIEDAENEPPPSALLGMEQSPNNNPENENVEEPNERLGSSNPEEKATPGKVTQPKIEKIAPTPAKDGRSKLFAKVLDAIKEYKKKFKDSDFDFTMVEKSIWRDLILEAQKKFNIYFDLENNEALYKQSKVYSIDNEDNSIKFRYQAFAAGGDWETPVIYYRCQFIEGYLPKLSHENKTAGCFIFIPNKKQGNFTLWKDDKNKYYAATDEHNTKEENDKNLTEKFLKEYLDEIKKSSDKTKDETPLKTLFKPSETTSEGLSQKSHIKYQGIDIIIENRKGTVRKGTDEAGNEFEVKMPADYGFIEDYFGNDGEAIDVFVGDNKGSDFVVIIKQRNIVTGGMDEEKIILGCNDTEEAVKLYVSAFDDSEQARLRIVETIEMNIETFKNMLNGGTE